MKQINLPAQVRSSAGKGVARKLRKEGRIPGVLYGPGSAAVSLSVDYLEFHKILTTGRGEQLIFNLNLENDGNSETRMAMVKDLQLHPVTDQIRHVDFHEIFMDRQVVVDIPVVPVGKAKGVEIEKGLLQIIQRTLKISCLPTAMPREIQIDVTDLGLGEALHVEDVIAPEGVRLLDDPKAPIVTIVGGAKEEAEVEEEIEVGAVTEEEGT